MSRDANNWHRGISSKPRSLIPAVNDSMKLRLNIGLLGLLTACSVIPTIAAPAHTSPSVPTPPVLQKTISITLAQDGKAHLPRAIEPKVNPSIHY